MSDLTVDHIPFFHEHLDRVAQREGFSPGRYSVTIDNDSTLNDGFMSAIVRVRITQDDDHRQLVLLCKVPLANETRRAQGIGLFERECRAYSELLPTLMEFQREKGLNSENGGFFNVPKCYDAFCEKEKLQALLIMEDLSERKFRMWNKLEPVDLDHTRMVFTHLGKLHAISFALREQRAEEFRKMGDYYKDPMLEVIEGGDAFLNMLKSMCDRAVGTLEPHEEFRREKVLQFKESMKEELIKCVRSEFSEPYAVLGHGDCWINNFMFTYADDDKSPKDVTFVDWQICRYGSPAIDLVYFMFLCTDSEFRTRHYTELLDLYYDSLGGHLQRLGGDAGRQFPKHALNKQLKKFGRFALVMAMLILPVICTPSEDLPDMDKAAEAVEQQDRDAIHIGTGEIAEERYRKRMGGVIRDLVQYGYL